MAAPKFQPDLVAVLAEHQRRLDVLERAARITAVGVYNAQGTLVALLQGTPDGEIDVMNAAGTTVVTIKAVDGSITTDGLISTTGDIAAGGGVSGYSVQAGGNRFRIVSSAGRLDFTSV